MSRKLQLGVFSSSLPQLLQTCLIALVLRVGQTTMLQPMFPQQTMMYPSFKYHQMEGQQLYPQPQQLHHQKQHMARQFEGKYRFQKMMNNNNKGESSNYQNMKLSAPMKSTILVESAHSSPVNIMFRSTSSSINVMQDHKPSKGTIRYMNTQEEPVQLVMNITKPIVQHVRKKTSLCVILITTF